MKQCSVNKLEDIGFYTLSDARLMQASEKSPLWRCELIITGVCNFKCPYCRGLKPQLRGTLSSSAGHTVLQSWVEHGLKNVRFSGGEPTLHPDLGAFISYCKRSGVERIAVSTNGSASKQKYAEFLRAGANDFSVSLDGACCAVGDEMAGNIPGTWTRTVDNIRFLAQHTYVTAGLVFTEANVERCIDTVLFADSLGVSDIRVIPSAQFNKALTLLQQLPSDFLDKYPILRYRINNLKNKVHVRGLSPQDSDRCHLVLDDMAVAADYHFPCIIYMREGGNPIGHIGNQMRQARRIWSQIHNTFQDPICKVNCLDVCRDYNNKWGEIANEINS